MSYRMQLKSKSRKSARFISKFQKALQEAFIASGKTQQELADFLEVDRSVINRRLKSSANLTTRSIREMADAMGRDFVYSFPEKETSKAQVNWTRPESDPPVSTPSVGPQGTLDPQRTFQLESSSSQ